MDLDTTTMTADEKISALLQESQQLTPGQDAKRLSDIYAEAASLVDRNAKPKQWAAFRFKFAECVEPIDPQAALDAYRESVTYFDPVQDLSMWASIKACIGYNLVLRGKVAPPESEQVIESFEDAVGELPYVSSTLALYYESRTIGDPLENWQKRVHYLEIALAQLARETDPVQWARLKNQWAMALTAEPDGDFVKATEKRIEFHQEALVPLEKLKDVSGSPAQNEWIKICINLSEAFAIRVSVDRKADLATSQQYAHTAYNTCAAVTPAGIRALATMGLARVLLNPELPPSRERYLEGLRLCNEAETCIDIKTTSVVAATNLKFKELAHLRLLELGEPAQLQELLKAADAAYQLLNPVTDSELQRTISQLAAEALVHTADYQRAIDYLQRAADAGERALQQATTRAGRLERIFELHDTYAVLGFCHFQSGNLGKGIEAIDKGKGRWWKPVKSFVSFEQVKQLIPLGGALVFTTFAPKDGAIAVVSQQGAELCQLRGFGQEKLKDLLLGDIRNPQGKSWIGRYIFRHTNPADWRGAIDSVGSELFELLWAPLLETLAKAGVKQNAELVWFPQAGLGVLPLHAAWQSSAKERNWILDKYAIRYAPSASCLLANAPGKTDGTHLFVSDPLGDLTNSALELAWVRQSEPASGWTVLLGSDAQKAVALNALARATSAYFSTHAVFQVSDPFQSSIILANGEHLTLEEWLPLLKNSSLREVVLSGCETAMSQVARRPDEFLGFPAALLEHGASTVIATQWPVDDWATAALMGHFYSEWHKTPASSPAQALRAAQRWLREVTNAELLQTLLPIKEQGGALGAQAAAIRTNLRKSSSQDKPLAHPYFWAAFTVSGQ